MDERSSNAQSGETGSNRPIAARGHAAERGKVLGSETGAHC
jgi:hypothetical protein